MLTMLERNTMLLALISRARRIEQLLPIITDEAREAYQAELKILKRLIKDNSRGDTCPNK